ncbi:hypothetical protein K0M31_010845 [Melipona bicolor]|uniref:Uncharacterized protein n=1 Tax=Melipona bicolor TaxID=60889 RepID=A0AA40KI02_9HYME|nr:hypothetical protein K0M31_010845 [Melipona bicolor]
MRSDLIPVVLSSRGVLRGTYRMAPLGSSRLVSSRQARLNGQRCENETVPFGSGTSCDLNGERFNVALLEDVSSRVSSYFRSDRGDIRTTTSAASAASAPVQKGISIWLESNVVPPMSPSLVKWILRCIAFSFQDWFIPVQDLQPGRGSIAVEKSPYGLLAARVGVYADVIDSVLRFVVPFHEISGKVVSTCPTRSFAKFLSCYSPKMCKDAL